MDLVLMLDVLEHIEDHLAAARHVREILAPGGAFVITVPALMGLWSQHDVANWHFRRYTKQSLQDVLTQAGFETESLQYFSGWTIGPMLLRRLATPAKGEAGDYRVRVPPRPVNAVMYGLSRVEQTVWGSRLPLGSSLLAIARPRT
jgi:SAM-dependent methyltransferase